MTHVPRIARQTTLAQAFTLEGVGVHGGISAVMTVRPAAADTGIVFARTDLDGVRVPCRHDRVAATELATVVGDPATGAVSTVEHLVAAFAGMGVDNALVEIDGPEVPILDGSAAPFCDAIARVGLRSLSAARRHIEVLKTVRVEQGAAWGELAPNPDGFELDVEIDFPAAVIGHQRIVVDLDPVSFRRELARARTFGFIRDVDRLRAAGFALGASLDNTVVIEGDRLLNPEPLRFADEFVRHKALDAIGDLSLAGRPLLTSYRSSRAGHRINALVLKALFADPGAYRVVGGEAIPANAGGYAALAAVRAPAT